MIFQSPGGNGGGAGAFWPALAASCALHVLLLWPDALPRDALQAGPALTATLRAARTAERPAPLPAGSPPEAEKAHVKAVPRQMAVASASQLRRLPPQPAAGPHAASAGETPSVAAAPGGAARHAGATVDAQAEEAGRPDADGIRAYRIGLAREARAHRQYPSLARERGWTGTAEVRVDVSTDGQPRQILLARSSGHDILDREAVNMMSRAAASAALPESLRGRAFAVLLPVVFDISEVQ